MSVLAFTLAFGLFLFTPSDLDELAKSSLASAFFASNIFFWKQVGYFDTAASQKPLLHTWSLAIEEQYYAVYPFLIVLLSRFYLRFRTPAVILGAALSFLTAVVLTYSKPSAAFYLGPTRAWELLVGGLLALWPSSSSHRATINLISAPLGLALVLIAVVSYNPLMRFPGVAALLPVVGAALIIWSGRAGPTSVHKWLSAGPVVSVGKASYSLYLWHFPISSFCGLCDAPRNDAFDERRTLSDSGLHLLRIASLHREAVSFPGCRGPDSAFGCRGVGVYGGDRCRQRLDSFSQWVARPSVESSASRSAGRT